MNDIIILGGGYIGSELSRKLYSKSSIRLFTRSRIDYTNVTNIRNILNAYKPSLVINACGYTGKPNIDACNKDSVTRAACWNLNVTTPVLIAQECDRRNINFCHISSGCIFNDFNHDRCEYTEYDAPNFGINDLRSSFYSKTKHAAETLLVNYPNTCIFRIRMPFSMNKSERNLFMKLRNYDHIIHEPNSVTCIEDLCDVFQSFYIRKWDEFHNNPGANINGIFHLVNPGIVWFRDVRDKYPSFFKENVRFYNSDEMSLMGVYSEPRSNCVLKDTRLQKLGEYIRNSSERIEQFMTYAKGVKLCS